MNSIKRLLICLLVFVLIFVANQIYEYNQNLTFSTLEGTKYNLKSNVQKDYLLIYFSLDCGTCTNTIRQVQANTQIEKAFDILLISAEKNSSKIRIYFEINNLIVDRYKLLVNENNSFENYFTVGYSFTFPVIIVYSPTRKVIKVVNNLQDLL